MGSKLESTEVCRIKILSHPIEECERCRKEEDREGRERKKREGRDVIGDMMEKEKEM